MIAGELLCIVGTQIVALGLCAHAYGTYFMNEKDPWFDRMRARYPARARAHARRRDPRSPGIVVGAVIVGIWIERGFGALSEERLAATAAALVIIGLQIFFSSFLLSILGLRRRD